MDKKLLDDHNNNVSVVAAILTCAYLNKTTEFKNLENPVSQEKWNHPHEYIKAYKSMKEQLLESEE